MKKRIGIRDKIRNVRKILAGMTKEPRTDKERRGFTAEEKALLAAKYWWKKKIILGVRQTKGFSLEDKEMKDLILTLSDGETIGIQVKNYCDYKVVQKCRIRGLLFFPIWEDDDEEIAKERMLHLIIAAYVSRLEPFQIRQLILRIPEIKRGPKPPSLMKRIFSLFRRASS